MKSFYVLPYVCIQANVIFDTKNEAEMFVNDMKNNCNFISAYLRPNSFAGKYYVSIDYEEHGEKYLVSLADEDLLETIDDKFTNDWFKCDIIQNNWMVYEEQPMIKCFIDCCDCEQEKEIDMTDIDFASFLYRNVAINHVNDITFMCNECYEFNSRC